MSLITQSGEIAGLLEAAVSELRRDRADDDTITFVDDHSLRTAKVRGATPEERRVSAVLAYAREVYELTTNPDGSDSFSTIDRTGLLRLLEDPLSAPARSARRLLLVAASIVFLMGATGQMPAKVPGFEFDLSGHPWIVGALALAVMLYQGMSFALYARADSARRSLAEDEMHEHVRLLRANVDRVVTALDTLEASEAAGELPGLMAGWATYAGGEVARIELESSAVRHRRRWDLWLPFPLVAAALFTFLWRWLLFQ